MFDFMVTGRVMEFLPSSWSALRLATLAEELTFKGGWLASTTRLKAGPGPCLIKVLMASATFLCPSKKVPPVALSLLWQRPTPKPA
jgi:hypothetical protein